MQTPELALERRALKKLALANTRFSKRGFALDLSTDPAQWDALLRSVGDESWALLAKELCREYRRLQGREFLFSEQCVARELAYHIKAYLWAMGCRWRRHISTWLFSRKSLSRHCRVVDISTSDARDLRQRVMFGYKKGVRKQYRGTKLDPFA